MKLRLMTLCATASLAMLALSAHAHDPKAMDQAMSADEPTEVPTTCAQLADTAHYSADLTNPDIKALKARCDAPKKPAEPSKKAATPTAEDAK